ncbi:MAG: hypothetical protein SVT56_05980 [Chloroflexota bacterium]|jgi:hypothetical protein|nr:hypothetical protein [Chloroflexota bacterium]
MTGKTMEKSKLKARILLLALQVLLPFGLYFAMQMGSQPLAVIVAALLGMSMLGLVWLG